MVSIECIERGVAAYVDKELLPKLDTGSAKGFGLGFAASLLIKRGGGVLREYAKLPILQQLGLVSQDGAVDIDELQKTALERMPKGGLPIDLPLGIRIRVTDADLNSLCDYIRQEARL